MSKELGKWYLESSLEEVIDHANNNSNESEIPFTNMALSAKAAHEQIKTSRRMLYISAIMVLVGISSAIVPFLIQKSNSKETSIVLNELSLIKKENTELRQKLRQIENLYHARSKIIENIEAKNDENRPLLEKIREGCTQSQPRT